MPIRPDGPLVRQTLVLPRQTLDRLDGILERLNKDRPIDRATGYPVRELTRSGAVALLMGMQLGAVEDPDVIEALRRTIWPNARGRRLIDTLTDAPVNG